MSAERLVLIALGSNLGDSPRVLRAAMDRLEELSAHPLRRSSLWCSAPLNCPPGSPDFVNAAVALVAVAGQTADSLLAQLQALEREFGRQPKQVHNEARPLDLDLIAFGQERRATPSLTLPHPRAAQRRFVLVPLAEVAPDFLLPGQSETIAHLLGKATGGGEVRRHPE